MKYLNQIEFHYSFIALSWHHISFLLVGIWTPNLWLEIKIYVFLSILFLQILRFLLATHNVILWVHGTNSWCWWLLDAFWSDNSMTRNSSIRSQSAVFFFFFFLFVARFCFKLFIAGLGRFGLVFVIHCSCLIGIGYSYFIWEVC